MDVLDFIKELLQSYGPSALPWSVVAYLGWTVLNERKEARTGGSVPPDLLTIIQKYEEVVIANTRAIERLAVLFEERTRSQHGK